MEPKEYAVSKERDDNGGGLPEPEHTAGHAGTAGSLGAPGRSEAPEHADEPERAARRPRLVVAAVAAAVLVAGGGGAWWATAASGGGGNAAAPAPLRMDGPGLSGPVTGGGPGPNDGGAYRLTGKLPDGPDKAALYRASGSITQADVQHLASLLGVSGPVVSDHDSWRVGGAPDGGGPSLLVSKSAPGTWSFTKYGPPSTGVRPDASGSSSSKSGTSTTDVVPPSPGTTSSASGTGSGPGSVSGSGPGADSGTPPVSAAKAEAVAKPVLDGLGLSDAAVDASQAVGSVRTVTADPRVGGLPTHGWGTSLQIGADGAVSLGYGRLSELTKGATYPVVSAATALKELNSVPRMHPDLSPSSCRVPLSGTNGGAVTRSAPSAPSTTPTAPAKGKLPPSVPCIPNTGGTVQVRGAAFGLALEFVSGVQTLVPSWLFDTASAGVARTAVVAQAAVSPSYIQGGTPSVPPVTPAPGRMNPGGPERPPNTVAPPGARGPHRVQVDGYTAGGSTLTLTYSGGLCDTYAASASESGSTVKVSVVATPKKPGTVCPMIIRSFTAKVTLDHPLGSRKVLDASDGQPLKGQ